MALTPPQVDGTSANPTLSTIGGFSALFLLIAGCLQLRPLRCEV